VSIGASVSAVMDHLSTLSRLHFASHVDVLVSLLNDLLLQEPQQQPSGFG
jgi:hypothetical protein